MKRSALLILTIFGLTAALPAQAASFNCAKAVAADEVAICQNPELSERDTEMAALWFAYNKVPMLMGANAARRDAATDFLKLRAACGSDTACLGRVYQARVTALRAEISLAMDALAAQQ
ncbi:lysozyme inhibitor LprI family protein [Kaistia terrae]|uniref:Lysozyme inhibitor LprI family protein n=1 Tax=Kaistia terrae TaxID=537017 RepID=A0ABW0PUU6_9HYPH|nr:hypothetical protein [Kaistia terrae]MCX5579578.1 hypothetical protein [Kaistia terrae]